jgi:hypothetical protein
MPNLPTRPIETITADLLPTLTADAVDEWWDRLGRVASDVREAVGLLLYWELRNRPGSYHAKTLPDAVTMFSVTPQTLTRWRTHAQEMFQLEPPDAKSAGQQRAGKAIKAQNTKGQVEGKARQTRFSPEQGKRETGEAAPIDTTAHLAPRVESPPNVVETAPSRPGKRAPERVSLRDAMVLIETDARLRKVAYEQGVTIGEVIDRLATSSGAPPKVNGRRREVTTNFKHK